MEIRNNEFRGKSIDDTCPDVEKDEWVYGDLFHGQKGAVFIHKVGVVGLIEVDPETVGQYIEIKDCNGREVYEGDIVEIKIGYCGSPRYHESTYQDVVRYNKKLCAYTPLDSADIYSVKVIGNIHNNPELLK